MLVQQKRHLACGLLATLGLAACGEPKATDDAGTSKQDGRLEIVADALTTVAADAPRSPPRRPILILSPAIVIDIDIVDGISPGRPVIFTLTNSGTAPTKALLSPEIGGINFGNFELIETQDRCTGIELQPGFRCVFAVRPLANGNGQYSGTLTLGDGEVTSNVGSLSGRATGFDPAVRLTATSGDPSKMNVPGGISPGPAMTFTVENEGRLDTSALARPTIVGSNPENFQIVTDADQCTGEFLAPGAHCTFQVVPVAEVNGKFSATLTVGDGNVVSNIASLSGVASDFDPALTLRVLAGDPSAMSVSGGTSPGLTVTFSVENTGVVDTAELRAPKLSDAIGGPHFEFVSDDCAGTILEPTQSCELQLRPFASVNGGYSATLSIDDGSVVSNELTLIGKASGFDPLLVLTATYGDPAEMTIQGSSPGSIVIFQLKNSGKASTSVLASPSLQGTHSTNFQLVGGQDECSGAILAPHAKCTFGIRPVSINNGAFSAVLTVHDAGTTSNEIALNAVASGLAPVLALSASEGNPTSMNITGSSPGPVVTFAVRNTGSAQTVPLAAPSIVGDTANFEIVSDDCAGERLVPGASCALRIRPVAPDNGTYSANLGVAAGPTSTNVVTLSGEATGLAAALTLSVDGDPRAMDIVGGQSPGPALTFTLTNSGTATSAAIATPRLYPNPDAFQVVSGRNECTGMKLAAGARCTFDVQPVASSNGGYSATLAVDAGALTSNGITLLGTASGF